MGLDEDSSSSKAVRAGIIVTVDRATERAQELVGEKAKACQDGKVGDGENRGLAYMRIRLETQTWSPNSQAVTIS
jgi:hypothetical protein